MEDFTELVKTLKAYDWGKSGAPLLAVDAEIRKVAGMPDRRAKLEDALLEVLKSDAPLAARRGVSKSLSLIATDRSAPALAAMLPNADTSDMARYVLERMPPGAADAVLRAAVRDTRGRICAGIVQSLGNRRDAQSVRVLTEALADADEETAQAAAWALGRLGGPEAMKQLRAYRRVARASVRAEVLDACLVCARRLAAEGRKAEAAAMYRELDVDGSPAPVRRAAARGLEAVNR
jgi:HEAT repeat protein